jgi:hypothetical protein
LSCNLPTIVDSVPVWCNTTGTALKQQLSTDVGFFAGPITSSAGTDPTFSLSNVFFGANPGSTALAAGISNVDGAANCAFGIGTLTSNVGGFGCSAFGESALQYNLDSTNTAVGAIAGGLLTTGTNNVFVGYDAGGALNTGQYNVIVGSGSGADYLVTGNNNVWVGASIDGASDSNIVVGNNAVLNSQNGCIAIGQGVTPVNSNELTLQLGNGKYLQTQFITTGLYTNGSGTALLAPGEWFTITINGMSKVIPLFDPF